MDARRAPRRNPGCRQCGQGDYGEAPGISRQIEVPQHEESDAEQFGQGREPGRPILSFAVRNYSTV